MRGILKLVALAMAACVLVPSIALAQGGTIRGRVADTTGTPVADAVVWVEATALRSMTGPTGEYVISAVPPGAAIVRVRRIGYVDIAPAPRVVVVAGGTVQQDFTLRNVANTLAPIVVGSRATHTAADELAVPVDVFTPEMIRSQGTTETAQILAQLAPSVNFPRQSVSDASEIVRPFTMRGLSPDHTLVLLNGKRRHHTALIHYYGAGQGAGSSGVDMNAFPASAIERLEVLRDGAAAQYGSDAIAGVVNVVLKEGVFAPFFSVDLGEYWTSEDNPAAVPSGGDRPSFPRDGRTINVNGGWGVPLGKGSVSLFAEYRDRDPTNRAGPDASDMFGGDADEVVEGDLVAKNNPIPMPNHHWGDGASKDLMTFATLRLPLGTLGAAGLYGFGGYSKREGTGFGYFRAPSSERNWTEIYPSGFLPEFAPDVVDLSAVVGARGMGAGWGYDFGVTYGHNAFEYHLSNTLNTSLGPCLDTACAPGQDGVLGTADDPGIPNQTSFFAGELRLSEAIFSADLNREFDVGFASPIHIAIGAAYRRENYEIVAGERASYINGFHPAADGSIAPSGSQVFPGFRPGDAADADRSNIGVYVDLEGDLVPRLLANVAVRFENYSDFGSKVTGKLALRFQPSPQITLRSAVSTGFRAPSLNQSFYSSVVTNFKADDVTGEPVPFEIGIFPVASAEARALGARELEAESSLNFSAGAAFSPTENFTLTADVFLINVDDRIVLTGFLDSDSVAAILRGIGSRAEAAQYFTNAIDTRTRGVDVTADYRVPTGSGEFGLNAAFNYTKTTIPNECCIPVPPELQGTDEELIGRFDEGGLLAMTQERPKWRGTVTGRYRHGAWNGLARYSHYGEYTSSLYSYSGDDVATYSAKGLFDVELGFTAARVFKIAVGARNLFDTYPDRMSYNNGFDIFPYPPASPFGYNGRFVYTRLDVNFGR
ncbi:MAG: TonB-dependent receptor [Gemmatimonadota bacterium]|nr:TonB-dependent receptor [Gemmatimonadota bacterium]